MRCQYCGLRKTVGERFVHDPKNKQDFCSLLCLRTWGKRHTGSKYFSAINKTVTE